MLGFQSLCNLIFSEIHHCIDRLQSELAFFEFAATRNMVSNVIGSSRQSNVIGFNRESNLSQKMCNPRAKPRSVVLSLSTNLSLYLKM